jgi:pyruvate,water dikinase
MPENVVMADHNSPVHTISAPETRWSRVNFAEAIQGIQTPLGWTFWDLAMETSVRRAFGNLGALSGKDVAPPTSPDDKMSSAFFGLPTGNVSTFHRIGEAMPGTNGDTVVEQLFGELRQQGLGGNKQRDRRAMLRYPVVAVKMPISAIRAARLIPGMRKDYRQWWRSAAYANPPATLLGATELLRESARRFIEIGAQHALISLVGQALAEQLELLAEKVWGSRAGSPDLMTGYGAMEETATMGDIWSVAHDEMTFDEFLARHGYHGPDEGNLTSRSWREDPTPARRLVERYKTSEVAHPRAREAAQAARRAQAEARLLAGLKGADRAKAKLVMRLAKATIPMRELGKAGFLHGVDGARCAARLIGAHLVEAGFVNEVEDVFFLTYAELDAGVSGPCQELVAERRADHLRYETLAVPASWIGNPVAEQAAPDAEADTDGGPVAPVTEIQGIGIVGEEVTGRARVVLDPAEADLEPGDILVCRTTDPSWTPLFLVADALVIDTGGAMSHGAIVARELGVTCVINTGTGTRDIPDGAEISVDARTGLVRLL